MMTPAARSLIESLGFVFADFAALWRLDLTRSELIADIEAQFNLDEINVSGSDANAVKAVMRQDFTELELLTLIASLVAGSATVYTLFTASQIAVNRRRDISFMERLAWILVSVGTAVSVPAGAPTADDTTTTVDSTTYTVDAG